MCGKCGSALISTLAHSQTKKVFYYYECSRARQKLGCDSKRISAAAFDEAVIAFFRRASQDQEIIVSAMGNALKDNTNKLETFDKEIQSLHKKLKKVKKDAEKLLNTALEKVITRGVTYSERMGSYEKEIAVLEDKLTKVNARRRAANISIHASEHLYRNLRFAMQHLDKAPPEAQINLRRHS